MNDGKWILQWVGSVTRHRQSLIVDNLEAIFDDLIRPRTVHQMNVVEYLRAAMTDSKAFLDMPGALCLVDFLPDSKTVPGFKNGYDRFAWWLNQFISAYASMSGVKLRVDEVEPYLIDVRRGFGA